MKMLTGSFAKDSVSRGIMQFQIGANVDQNVRVYVGTMTAQALGLTGGQGNDEVVSVASPDTANVAITTIDEALKRVNSQRADLGAYQNRFELASQGISTAAENLQASESLIRDTDMASAIVDYTKNQILTQSGTAMLAQANTQAQNILSLIS